MQDQIQILRDKFADFFAGPFLFFCLKFNNVEEDKQYWRVALIDRDYIVPEWRNLLGRRADVHEATSAGGCFPPNDVGRFGDLAGC